jgi:hypothetical protein
MVLEGWGAFVVQPQGTGRARLLIRSSIGGPDTSVWGAGLTSRSSNCRISSWSER